MIQYQLIKERTPSESAMYDSYGIVILCDGEPVRVIGDLSTSYDAARILVDLCNREELDPIHLDEVIENFLFAGSSLY